MIIIIRKRVVMPYIQINKNCVLTINHVTKPYQKGDIIKLENVDRCITLIASGEATPVNIQGLLNNEACGIISPHEIETPYEIPFTHLSEDYYLPYPSNLFCSVAYFNHVTMPIVLRNLGKTAYIMNYMDRVDVVLILGHHKQTIVDMNTSSEEKIRTQEIVGDLRIPYYYSSVFGIKKSKAGEAFFQAYEHELMFGSDLALVRALYQVVVKPLYLPANWGEV